MNTKETYKSKVEKFFSSLGKKDHIVLSETYFHKDHKFHFPLFPDPVSSKEHKKMDEDFLSGFPDTKILIDDIFTADDKVVLRAKFAGTHSGTFNNIPATGKKINLPFIAIIKMEDGKNIEEWVEMDTSKMFKQLQILQEQL